MNPQLVISIRDHFNAVKAQLELDQILNGSVFDMVIDPTRDDPRPTRYVNMFMDNGRRTSERVTGPQAFADFTITLHSCGQTREQCQLVAERVFAQMLGARLVVPGRRCRRIRHSTSVPMDRDTNVLPAVYYCVDEFTLISDPA